MHQRHSVRAVRQLGWLAAALLAGSAIAGGAHAQSCPSDLTSMDSQISEPDLQAMLAVPMATLIANAGSSSQAIANVTAKLARATQIQANLGNADDDATKAYAADLVAVLTAQLNALNCVQQQGG